MKDTEQEDHKNHQFICKRLSKTQTQREGEGKMIARKFIINKKKRKKAIKSKVNIMLWEIKITRKKPPAAKLLYY